MKIALFTLGCKTNQYETQAMEHELLRRGHTLIPFDEPADVYLINTCTVTAVSDKKSRAAIRRARRQNPHALIAVCGCYAQLSQEELQSLSIDVLGGSADRMAFLDHIESAVREHRSIVAVDDAFARQSFEELSPGSLAGRTRAMLKIEDGCVNFCSYCIIPYARGRVRSLPLSAAKRRAEELMRDGYREIVLTGIEISSYGNDLADGSTLIDALETICHAAPDCRIRLGSLEPRTITPEFCVRAHALDNLCPQFHLSLQSGCDATLARMNRKYDTARYWTSVTLLRDTFHRPALTTDLIVGFPGETEEEFSQTLSFIERCAFSKMHIFPYSVRPGTPAAQMRQVPPREKESRARRAADCARAMETAYLDACVGETYDVLFETPERDYSVGHAPNYAQVRVRGDALQGLVRRVHITGRDGLTLTGDLL